MIPMTLGFLTMGPIGGALSDRYGARGIATIGMTIVAAAFVILTFFSYNFTYLPFGATIYMLGFGSGMFAAPNTAAIMNSVSAENRGISSGMVATVRNVAQTASMGIFFTIVILALSTNLPHYFNIALTSANASGLATYLDKIPPTSAIFSAFLGYNPMQTILSQIPSSYLTSLNLSSTTIATLESNTWFPLALAPAVMHSLRDSFYIGAILSVVAAILSLLRGKKYYHPGGQIHNDPNGEDANKLRPEINKGEMKGKEVSKNE